jgi:hypothetical protein
MAVHHGVQKGPEMVKREAGLRSCSDRGDVFTSPLIAGIATCMCVPGSLSMRGNQRMWGNKRMWGNLVSNVYIVAHGEINGSPANADNLG